MTDVELDARRAEAPEAPVWRVEFSRIGRHSDVPPLDVDADDLPALARLVEEHTAGYSRARSIEAFLFDDGHGEVSLSGYFGGSFTWTAKSQA